MPEEVYPSFLDSFIHTIFKLSLTFCLLLQMTLSKSLSIFPIISESKISCFISEMWSDH